MEKPIRALGRELLSRNDSRVCQTDLCLATGLPPWKISRLLKRFEIFGFILDEFREHRPEIVKKSGLSEGDVSSFILLLSPKIRFFETEEFKEFLPEAKRISHDPNDVEYIALALKLNCSIWSEDKGLKQQTKVKVLSTKELIELLGL